MYFDDRTINCPVPLHEFPRERIMLSPKSLQLVLFSLTFTLSPLVFRAARGRIDNELDPKENSAVGLSATREPFGATPDGAQVDKYTIGARIHSDQAQARNAEPPKLAGYDFNWVLNNPGATFPSTELKPGQKFTQTTIYRFLPI